LDGGIPLRQTAATGDRLADDAQGLRACPPKPFGGGGFNSLPVYRFIEETNKRNLYGVRTDRIR